MASAPSGKSRLPRGGWRTRVPPSSPQMPPDGAVAPAVLDQLARALQRQSLPSHGHGHGRYLAQLHIEHLPRKLSRTFAQCGVINAEGSKEYPMWVTALACCPLRRWLQDVPRAGGACAHRTRAAPAVIHSRTGGRSSRPPDPRLTNCLRATDHRRPRLPHAKPRRQGGRATRPCVPLRHWSRAPGSVRTPD
jgi:hypothetical protein